MKQGDYHTDAQAKDYDYNRFKGGLSVVHQRETEIISKWIKKAGVSDESLTLDVGAGTGRIIGQILKYHPKKILAIDVSSAMLKQLSKNYQKEVSAGLIKPICSSSDDIPLKKNSIDLATSLHLFKHLNDPRSTIASIAKVLKPKGYFIFDALNINSIIRFNLQDCSAYSFVFIEDVLRKEGLIVKETIYLQNFGETIYSLAQTIFATVVYQIDTAITNSPLKLGTKMLILAQKL